MKRKKLKISPHFFDVTLISGLKCVSSKKSREIYEWLGDALLKVAVEKVLLGRAQECEKTGSCSSHQSQWQGAYLVDKAVCNSNLADAFDRLGLPILFDTGMVSPQKKKHRHRKKRKNQSPDLFGNILSGKYYQGMTVKCRADFVEAIIGELASSEYLQLDTSMIIDEIVSEILSTEQFSLSLEEYDAKRQRIADHESLVDVTQNPKQQFPGSLKVLGEHDKKNCEPEIQRNCQRPFYCSPSLSQAMHVCGEFLLHIDSLNSSRRWYQQLEHFGSSILQYITSQQLFLWQSFQEKSPCELTRLRQSILSTQRLKLAASAILHPVFTKHPILETKKEVLRIVYPEHCDCCLEQTQVHPCAGLLLHLLRLILGNCGIKCAGQSQKLCSIPSLVVAALFTAFTEEQNHDLIALAPCSVQLPALTKCNEVIRNVADVRPKGYLMKKTKPRKKKKLQTGKVAAVAPWNQPLEVKLQRLDRDSRSLLERFGQHSALQKLERLVFNFLQQEASRQNELSQGQHDSPITDLESSIPEFQLEKLDVAQNGFDSLKGSLVDAGIIEHDILPGEKTLPTTQPGRLVLWMPDAFHRRLLHILCKAHGFHSSSPGIELKNKSKAVIISSKGLLREGNNPSFNSILGEKKCLMLQI